MNSQDILISPADLAKRWNVNTHTLMRWRKDGTGPPFIKIGRRIYYNFADVLIFEQERTEV